MIHSYSGISPDSVLFCRAVCVPAQEDPQGLSQVVRILEHFAETMTYTAKDFI